MLAYVVSGLLAPPRSEPYAYTCPRHSQPLAETPDVPPSISIEARNPSLDEARPHLYGLFQAIRRLPGSVSHPAVLVILLFSSCWCSASSVHCILLSATPFRKGRTSRVSLNLCHTSLSGAGGIDLRQLGSRCKPSNSLKSRAYEGLSTLRWTPKCPLLSLQSLRWYQLASRRPLFELSPAFATPPKIRASYPDTHAHVDYIGLNLSMNMYIN